MHQRVCPDVPDPGHAGVVNTSQVAYFIPFSALLIGVIWLGESVNSWSIGGFCLVILGLWIKDRSQKSAPAR